LKSNNQKLNITVFNVIFHPLILSPIEAGDGVFLKCSNPDQKIIPGTLLGIVPGVLYSSFEPPVEDPRMEDPRVEKNYLTLYDNTYLKYSDKIPFPIKFGYCNRNYS